MDKTFIFGHKKPDTDSITSAITMANLEKRLGNNVEAVKLGNINKETKYVFEHLGMNEPETIQEVDEKQEVILVDHNEFAQSADNIEKAHILKVVDHHTMCFNCAHPLYYRAEPVGCTATVLFKMYRENEIKIDKQIATLMLSAIISDTLLFKSPTCTEQDKKIAEALSEIAQIDMQTYGLEMLKAGTDISDLSAEEIIDVDAKEFNVKDKKFYVAQINTADINDVMGKKEQIENAIKDQINGKNLDFFLFAATDIINNNSQVIALGDQAKVVEKAYHIPLQDNSAFLEGVVSRKKQIIPIISENL